MGRAMKITFLGGVREVTGSKYLVEQDNTKILVDCGLYQGTEETTAHNAESLPIDPESINAVILTHAHIDHTGYIPRLVKDGFKGNIYCSQATFELSAILLVDSGFIQEENARREGGKIEPLYTKKDAQNALQYFTPINYDLEVKLGGSLSFKLISSHHILGAAFVVLSDSHSTLTFSGDLGRPQSLTMKAPPPLIHTDYLVLESTYGNRLHAPGDPIGAIGRAIRETIERGGVTVIPVFAVGRAQTILYILYQLIEQNKIADVPIFLDSPMAIKVTDLFCKFKDEHVLSVPLCNKAFDVATYTRTAKESKHINDVNGSAIIIAGSGMADGGRVLHHLKHFVGNAKNTILFVGYQAEETGGRALVEGAKKIQLFGKSYDVHAQIKNIDMLSAHADYNEILEWLSYLKTSPKKIFLTHGEVESAESLKKKIEERFGGMVVIPKHLESFNLD